MISRLAMNKEFDKALHVPCERVFMDRSRTRDKFKVLDMGHLSKLGFFNELVTLINHSIKVLYPYPNFCKLDPTSQCLIERTQTSLLSTTSHPFLLQ